MFHTFFKLYLVQFFKSSSSLKKSVNTKTKFSLTTFFSSPSTFKNMWQCYMSLFKFLYFVYICIFAPFIFCHPCEPFLLSTTQNSRFRFNNLLLKCMHWKVESYFFCHHPPPSPPLHLYTPQEYAWSMKKGTITAPTQGFIYFVLTYKGKPESWWSKSEIATRISISSWCTTQRYTQHHSVLCCQQLFCWSKLISAAMSNNAN